jgi:hypothetical protein
MKEGLMPPVNLQGQIPQYLLALYVFQVRLTAIALVPLIVVIGVYQQDSTVQHHQLMLMPVVM